MTDEYIATLLDSTGIQNYVFGSNRLREHIGASELVACATSTFVEEALLKSVSEQHNLLDLTLEQSIESNPGQRAEILFQGGGNVALLFRTLEDAQATVRELSRILLEQAPGLELAAVHKPFDWTTEKLAVHDGKPGIMQELAEQMVLVKQQRVRSAPILGLGVTMDCRSTGLPASCMFTDPDGTGLPISATTAAKIMYRDNGNQRLKTIMPNALQQSYTFPDDFDDMGRSHGELSYLAVVHIDGNGMGKRFQAVGNGEDNRSYINKLRALSGAINAAGQNALRKTIEEMAEMLRHTEPQKDEPDHVQAYRAEVSALSHDLSIVPSNHSDAGKFLPFRPLVYGGDDVTFVCDGRLGLALAVQYIQALEAETATRLTEPVHACAGVAIVKTHYPFVRAYELAENLCQNAKDFVRERQREGKEDASALDWHVAASGRGDSIAEIRKREYQAKDGKELNLRPLLLRPGSDDKLRSWSVVEQACWQLKYSNDWYERRNKVMALRETLRQGAEEVAQFRTRYNLAHLPQLSEEQSTDGRKKGFQYDRCLYFDAIEALDIFLPLAPVAPLVESKEQ
jgi:hypothetical protein